MNSPAAADIALSAIDPPPDWATVDHDLLCPLCDYNLRGLIAPRCPECGHRFSWREIQQEKLREHPYLFEHHPRENIRSFLRTFRASLRPRRFWSDLQPIHRPRTKRLMIFALIATLWCLLFSLPALLTPALTDYVTQWAVRDEQIRLALAHPDWFTRTGGSVQAYISSIPAPSSFFQILQSVQISYWMLQMGLPILLIILAWPWMTLLALLLYRASMRQARIKPAHVLRCVIYTADATFLIAPLLLAGALLEHPIINNSEPFHWISSLLATSVSAGVVVPLLVLECVLTYRLSVAYSRYLHFPHSFAAVVASQVIFFLVMLKIYYLWRMGL